MLCFLFGCNYTESYCGGGWCQRCDRDGCKYRGNLIARIFRKGK